jgi:hypothetical protein
MFIIYYSYLLKMEVCIYLLKMEICVYLFIIYHSYVMIIDLKKHVTNCRYEMFLFELIEYIFPFV